ncbi:uncharacterized protein LOC128397651 [Panonychus citri]|uniref:uncharacterized protein LOC128389135 n=1 Tax=Panonychus citri TaxID=50023 RepID=UPI0023078E2C|nr:uncharacterized protein LOC128389135 [Panonychus citri]XP_053214370.1 uncharacterized protein LOC128397651 [Panonychus citri]
MNIVLSTIKSIINKMLPIIKMIYENITTKRSLVKKCQPQDLIVAFEKLKSIERSKFIINKSTTSKFQRFMCYFILIMNNIFLSRWLILSLTNNKTLQFILGDNYTNLRERAFINVMIYIASYQGMIMSFYVIWLNNFVDKPFISVLKDYVEGVKSSRKVFHLSDDHDYLFRKWYTNGIRIYLIYSYGFMFYDCFLDIMIIVTEQKDFAAMFVQIMLLCMITFSMHFSSFSNNWFMFHWLITVLFTYCRVASFTTEFTKRLLCLQDQKIFILELQKFSNWLDSFNRQINPPTLFNFSYTSFFTVVIVYYGSQHNFSNAGVNMMFRGASIICITFFSTFCFLASFIPRKGKRIHIMTYNLCKCKTKDVPFMLKRLEILDRFSYRNIGLYLNEGTLICNHFSIIFLMECVTLYLLMYANLNR